MIFSLKPFTHITLMAIRFWAQASLKQLGQAFAFLWRWREWVIVIVARFLLIKPTSSANTYLKITQPDSLRQQSDGYAPHMLYKNIVYQLLKRRFSWAS